MASLRPSRSILQPVLAGYLDAAAGSTTTRYACSSSAYVPSPRSCHACPLFATCRLHSTLPSRPYPSSRLPLLRRRGFNTWSSLRQHAPPSPSGQPSPAAAEISIPTDSTAVPGRDLSSEAGAGGGTVGKGKEKVDAVETKGKMSEAKRKAPALRPRKEVITLTPAAVDHLARLLELPEPKLIRVGVKNKGCAGMSYHLEYVDKPGRFDEVVKAPAPGAGAGAGAGSGGEEVSVVIDSKALFSIIGSEMDWEEGRMGSKFVFKNPNIKEQCGCGESFMV